MNNNYEYMNLVESYVSGALEGEELSSFLKELATNKGLQDQVAVQQSLYDVLLDADALNLKAMMSNDLNQSSKPTSNNLLSKKIIIAGLAGLAVVVGITFLFWDKEELIENPITEIEEVVEVQETTSNKRNKEQVLITETTKSTKNTQTTIVHEDKNVSEVINKVNETDSIEGVSPVEKIVQEEKLLQLTPSEILEIQEEKIAPLVIKEADSCNGIRFIRTPETEISEKGKSNGKILLSQSNVTGGTEPYSFDLDKKGDFYETEEFTSMGVGEYTIYVKDAKGCKAKLDEPVKVGATLCKNDYISTFEISREDSWILPISEYEDQDIQVILINKVGQQYVNRTVEAGDEMIWDGYFDNGSRVKMGTYRWIIKHSSGEVCKVKMQVQN